MTSILKVDTIQDTAGNNIINESGDTITIGASGDTITIPSGATLDVTSATVSGITSYTDTDALDLFNASGSAPVFASRAWVNFNGTGTPAINGSGNVSSITDNGTGDYTVNFTTAFADANYCGTAICGFGTDSNAPNMHMAEISRDASPTTTTFRVDTMSAGVTQRDLDFINLAFFR
jgi:hypothetical protein